MLGQVITLSALVALGQTKAIVTNNCRKDIYIWSVPEKPDLANNLSISPGKRYEEPWRSGTAVTPGVAIKVSTEPDGIFTGKSEINLQYDVDPSDSTKIWIDLATVHGNDFDTVTLNTCHGGFAGPNVSTRQCSSTDDIELVLCGSERTVPARDTTPSHVISNCIGLLAEREGPPHPRLCSGRVVGSKRIPMPSEDRADQYLAERLDTVPLKTAMRLEAAKHAASEAADTHNAPRARNTAAASPETTMDKSTTSGPLCDLIRRAWPGAECDENTAEHNAKLFYHDNCGKKTRDLFRGISCEDIRREMEKIYPDVKTKRGDHKTMCINQYYPVFEKFWGSKRNVKAVLNHGPIGESLPPRYAERLFWDRSWTSDEELCRMSNRTVSSWGKESRRCVNPFCHRGGVVDGDCSDVEDELEKLSQDAGWDINWTSSDDECKYMRTEFEKRDLNTTVVTRTGRKNICINDAYWRLSPFKIWQDKETIKDNLNHIFRLDDLHWTSDEEQCKRRNNTNRPPWQATEKKRCVKAWCIPGQCSDVEDALNDISKGAGKNIGWTTSDDECNYRSTNAKRDLFNTTTATRRDHKTLCIKHAYRKLAPFSGDKRDIKATLNHLFDDRSYTSDEEQCESLTNTITEGPLFWTREERCIKSLCSRFSLQSGNCSDFEDALSEISRDAGKHVEWGTDDEQCDDKRAAAAKRDLSTVTTRRENDVRNVCVITANEKLGKYWGADETERLVETIFPDIRWTSDTDDCAPHAISESRAYHRKLINKKQDKEKKCVPGCEGKTCKRVKKELNKLSKDLGKHWSWTDDEAICAKNITFGKYGPTVCGGILGYDAVDKLHKYWGSDYKSMLEDIFEGHGFEIGSGSASECAPDYQNAAKVWLKSHARKGGKRCVSPYCKRFNADCSDVEDQLEKVSKHVGYWYDWTTDDDACPPTSVDQVAFPLTSPLAVVKVAPSDPGTIFETAEVCIKEICPLYPSDGVCLEVANAVAGHLFGDHLEFTVNGNACHGVKPFQLPPALRQERDQHKICGKQLCQRLNNPEHDCEELEQQFQSVLKKAVQVDVEFTDNKEVCGRSLAHAALGNPKGHSTKPALCSKAYCAPRVPGVDCIILERDFGEFLNIANISSSAHATSKVAVCRDESVLYWPVLHDEKKRQKVCVRDVCTIPQLRPATSVPQLRKDCVSLFPQIERYYKYVHDVEIVASIDDDVCGKETVH